MGNYKVHFRAKHVEKRREAQVFIPDPIIDEPTSVPREIETIFVEENRNEDQEVEEPEQEVGENDEEEDEEEEEEGEEADDYFRQLRCRSKKSPVIASDDDD